jgi:hypothetical protein
MGQRGVFCWPAPSDTITACITVSTGRCLFLGEKIPPQAAMMEGVRMQTVTHMQLWCHAEFRRQSGACMPLTRSLASWAALWMSAFATLLFSSLMAQATVVIPVSEDDLAQSASAIVIGQVKGIESYWDQGARQVFTHITVTAQEVLKGAVRGSEFTVKQLGGVVGNVRSWVDGSPEFRMGEKVLLFLDTNPDGSVQVAQLYQGKFSLFTDSDTGKEFAYRGETPEGVHVLTGTRSARSQTAATANAFSEVTALKERIRGALRAEAREQRAASAPLSQLPLPLGLAIDTQGDFAVIGFPPIRWFEPDSETPITVSLNPTNIFSTGEEQIDAGLRVWNGARQSTFRFNKGVTTDSKGFSADGVNAISFNDPSSQLADPVNCTGILAAVTYVAMSDERRTLHEQIFIRILEADLVFANGWDNCVAYRSAANIAEVATHELGHMIGLGHSANPEATMFSFAHFDGRGATLHPDDESGAAFLYPDASFPPCTYAISPGKRSLAGAATSAKFSVSTRSGCGWTAVSTVPWITISEGGSSSGKGQVIYTVEGNSAKTARRGTIMVAGKTFTVTQKGASTSSGIPRFFAR